MLSFKGTGIIPSGGGSTNSGVSPLSLQGSPQSQSRVVYDLGRRAFAPGDALTDRTIFDFRMHFIPQTGPGFAKIVASFFETCSMSVNA
jgi:hypothetical protein